MTIVWNAQRVSTGLTEIERARPVVFGRIKQILDEYHGYKEMDDRTLAILKGRIPAFLSSYRTLEDIGMEFHVTRERIRQI